MALKLVHSPAHNRNFVLGGRKRPVAVGPRFRLCVYLLAALPQPAASTDYGVKATNLELVYLNDRYGCCVISSGYHVTGVETANSAKEYIASDAVIVHDYEKIGGFDPNNPQTTDNGCDENTALDWWQNNPFANGTKLLGSLVGDATNQTEVKQGIQLFENAIICAELPDAWVDPFPSGDGFVWDVAGPSVPSNGHSFMAYGYNAQGVLICSWGMKGLLTWAALAKYCTIKAGGSINFVLTPDQVTKGQINAPNGFAWTALIADFDAMGGHVPLPTPPAPVPVPPAPVPPPVPAPPAPVPPPVPAPTRVVTLQQIELCAIDKLAKGPYFLTRAQAEKLVVDSLTAHWDGLPT